MTTPNVETAPLAGAHAMSRVIRGGWQLAGDHGPVDPAEAVAQMEAFLDAGITTFDCADIYRGVEEMIGAFIADLRRRRGREAADRVVVHTKLVPDLGRLADIRPHEIEAIVDRSLARLRIERLHLVQFFWWDLGVGDPQAALAVLDACRRKGKVGAIGVTNWDSGPIARFRAAGVDVVSAQVQYSLLDRRPAGGLADWARAHDVALLCYGTLAGGFMTDAWLGRPDPGFAHENRSLVKYRLIIDEFGPWDMFQELLATLRAIADRHGVSIASVATRWVLDQPGVAAAIVGARYARHLPRTLEVFGFSLDEGDLRAIDAVLARARGPAGPVYGLESDRDGRHGRIMKYNLNTNANDAVHGAL
ncbi:aldo/keto reductase [Salinarimonas sp. NSM]|uniref:aldo/keto reductase n=1 Tax=Salinarimonas sp. NSM TaxID=3458003 RepID=UPI004035110E